MQLRGEAVRVTIYIGESDRHHGGSLYRAILETLRREGASGATVTRALAGFGAASRIHTAGIEVLSSDLPIRIEWIDAPQRVERLLPELRRMIDGGLIVHEPVTVVHYSAGRGQDPLSQPVGRIMQEEVVTAPATTAVADVVTLLLERGVRCLPLVDDRQRLVGILTDGDLLHGAGLATRLSLQRELPDEQAGALLAALRQLPLVARDIMTVEVVSVRSDEPVRTAVTRMVQRDLKRLPVVDDEGRVRGMVSRIDVFRAVELHQSVATPGDDAPRQGHSVAELMYTDVPTVGPTAPVEEIVRTLEASHRRRAVVVDEERHVLGIITDGDLLRRSQQKHHPGLLARLRGLLLGEPGVDQVLPDAGERAADLMTAPATTVRVETPLAEALRLMTDHGIKRLPVVDADGRLVGLLGRASVLRGLLEDERSRRDDYLVGAPELVVEIAASSANYDMLAKKRVYARSGVQEVLAVLMYDLVLHWYVPEGGVHAELQPGNDATLHSAVFPGLWLRPDASGSGDMAGMLTTVQQGRASPEHGEFVKWLDVARLILLDIQRGKELISFPRSSRIAAYRGGVYSTRTTVPPSVHLFRREWPSPAPYTLGAAARLQGRTP